MPQPLVLRVCVAALVLGVVATACSTDPLGETTTTSPPASSTTSTVAEEATTTVPLPTTTELKAGKSRGGSAILGEDQEPTTLNPFAPGGDNFITIVIGQAYLASVWDVDGYTGELVPEIVTELPTSANGGVLANDDGTMTVHYTIRDDAAWGDDVPISGDDFAFTLELLNDEGLELESPGLYGMETPYGEVIAHLAGPKTFSVTFPAPTIDYERMFRVVVPKHAVEGSDFLNDWNDRMWPSAGPFKFASWDRGDRIVLDRNDAYWGTDPTTGLDLPYLDSVEFHFIPETEELVRAFRAREVDVIRPPPFRPEIERLQALKDGVRVEVLAGSVWEHLNFQFGPGRLERNPQSMNHNLNYRRAVAHLIDREALGDPSVVELWQPIASYLDAFRPPLSTDAWDRYPYDPERARALLDQVKADEGIDTVRTIFSTTSNGDIRIRIANALQPMFEAVGIEYENQLEDSQLFFGNTLDNGTWDLGLWAWVGISGYGGIVDIHRIVDPNDPPPDGSNFYRWGTGDSSVRDESTERFAALIDEARATVEPNELESLIHEAEEILADQVVLIPLFGRPSVGAVWEDEIGGFKHNPTLAGHTWNIGEWYRADL